MTSEGHGEYSHIDSDDVDTSDILIQNTKKKRSLAHYWDEHMHEPSHDVYNMFSTTTPPVLLTSEDNNERA